MKRKKLNKGLSLNKTTVANLEINEMKGARGGYYYTDFEWTCRSWCGCETNFYHCDTEMPHCFTEPIELCM